MRALLIKLGLLLTFGGLAQAQIVLSSCGADAISYTQFRAQCTTGTGSPTTTTNDRVYWSSLTSTQPFVCCSTALKNVTTPSLWHGYMVGGLLASTAYNWYYCTNEAIPTAVSITSPIIITANNNYSNGDTLWLTGFLGQTGANGIFTISNVSSTQFTLDGSVSAGAWTVSTGAIANSNACSSVFTTSTIAAPTNRFHAPALPTKVVPQSDPGTYAGSYTMSACSNAEVTNASNAVAAYSGSGDFRVYWPMGCLVTTNFVMQSRACDPNCGTVVNLVTVPSDLYLPPPGVRVDPAQIWTQNFPTISPSTVSGGNANALYAFNSTSKWLWKNFHFARSSIPSGVTASAFINSVHGTVNIHDITVDQSYFDYIGPAVGSIYAAKLDGTNMAVTNSYSNIVNTTNSQAQGEFTDISGCQGCYVWNNFIGTPGIDVFGQSATGLIGNLIHDVYVGRNKVSWPLAYRGVYGTCNTSGTAVTWVSGSGTFPALPTGSTILINNVTYTITSVNSPTSITLSGSAGTQTGVAFHWAPYARQAFEMKTAVRYQFQGNVITNTWYDNKTGNLGSWLSLSARTDDTGPNPNSNLQLSDGTIDNNLILSAPGGLNVAGSEEVNALEDNNGMHRTLVTNNVMKLINGYDCDDSAVCVVAGQMIKLTAGVEDFVFSHNTVWDQRGLHPYPFAWLDNRGAGFLARDNVIVSNWIGSEASGNGGAYANTTTTIVPALPTTTGNNGWNRFRALSNTISYPGEKVDTTTSIYHNLFVPGVFESASGFDPSVYTNPAKIYPLSNCTAYWVNGSSPPGVNSTNWCQATGTYANQVFDNAGFVSWSTGNFTPKYNFSGVGLGTDGKTMGADTYNMSIIQGILPAASVRLIGTTLYYETRDTTMQCYIDTSPTAPVDHYTARAADTPGSRFRSFALPGGTHYYLLSCAGGMFDDTFTGWRTGSL